MTAYARSGHLYLESCGSNIGAAWLALVLSAGTHLATLYWLHVEGIDLGLLTGRVPPEALRQEQPMRLLNVHRDPAGSEIQPQFRPSGDWLPAALFPAGGRVEELTITPDRVTFDPPPVPPNRLAGAERGIADPSATPKRSRWEARQEILAVETEIVADEVSALPRKRIPRIERVREAPDVLAPVERGRLSRAATTGPEGFAPRRGAVEVVRGPVGGMGGRPAAKAEERIPVDARGPERAADRAAGEGAGPNSGMKPIEEILKARLSTFSSFLDRKHGYFRVEIQRAGAEVLPVIPKDVVLVQDCSTSIAEHRLRFCREGLTRCLGAMGEEDRLNVVKFRDRADRCFETWAKNSPENREAARRFIEEMRTGGGTDILASLKDIAGLRREPGRPVVALVVTDGLSTTGTVNSSRIIGEFSKLNAGAVSVFTVGTLQTANAYLLDLLSFCNRGDSLVVTEGRWDIPEAIESRMRGVSRPVLADLGFVFSDGSGIEVYPVLTSNLYLDRPLVLYGRYPSGSERLVFQAVGKAGETKCDMVFDLALDKAARALGDRAIREDWAKQKIYHLIGQYARTPDPRILREIAETGDRYDVRVPYSGKF